MTLAFYGQPKFSTTSASPVGYELFIREKRDNHWVLPVSFTAIHASQIENLLRQVLTQVPSTTQILSFNLEPSQFVQPVFIKMVARIQQQTQIHLITELTERFDASISHEQLVAAAQQFHQDRLLVCIDDVGTERNTPQLVQEMNPYVDEFKFAFQNLRPFKDIQTVEHFLKFWYSVAKAHNKVFAVEGLETAAELQYVTNHYQVDLIQGYYTGRHELLVAES